MRRLTRFPPELEETPDCLQRLLSCASYLLSDMYVKLLRRRLSALILTDGKATERAPSRAMVAVIIIPCCCFLHDRQTSTAQRLN